MGSKRRIFIGDVQGCRDELERLLDRVRFDPATDRLFFVGDLVNRGPDSLGVLALARRLGAATVLGNHEVHLLRVAAGKRALSDRDTFGDVLAAANRDDLLSWLRSQPLVRRFEDLWLVHAALHADWDDPVEVLAGLDPLAPHPDLDFATRARYSTRRGERPKEDWPPPRAPFAPWYEHWLAAHPDDARTVVFGHWAREGLVVKPRLRGLDSGCVWGGKLSAWIAEEDRVVQVTAARAYAEYD